MVCRMRAGRSDGVDRLQDKRIRASPERGLDLTWVVAAGHDDQHEIGVLFTQMLETLETVHRRHRQVHQDDVSLDPPQDFQ